MTHEAGAGPAHGPAHRGDLGSAEPGGFDEFDHPSPAAGAGAGPDIETQTEPEEQPDATAQTESEPGHNGAPVVSDGTAAEGDSAEPVAGAGEPAYRLSESPEARLAAERLEDLRRLQAEYVNYKKRVDRDRDRAREAGISYTLEALLPVLDDIHMAREHGDLQEGPFAAIAEKLEAVLARLGIERFGSAGEEFDPMHHEALMHIEAELDPAATTTTIVQVLQPGYRLGDRVVRAARVAVADPQ